jgi:3-hydroxyisobutyrate dehydrogenase
MAGRLLDAGWSLSVHNRTRRRAQDLLDRGAAWAESPAELARSCDVILTILGTPEDVEDIYMGELGLVEQARPGAILADMTTSRPDLAVRIRELARRREVFALDAPVSGGDVGAREGTLSIMVGGDPISFGLVRPLLEILGSRIVLQGEAGTGQHAKMANQIVIAGTVTGVCEGLAYAHRAGLDMETLLKSISTGAAGSWTLSNLAPRIISGDFAPGFFVKHFIKDMRIAEESADAMGLGLPSLGLALSQYEELAEEGGADMGTQALYRLYENSEE